MEASSPFIEFVEQLLGQAVSADSVTLRAAG